MAPHVGGGFGAHSTDSTATDGPQGAAGGTWGAHHPLHSISCRDYARCDPESEEEGRMEGEYQTLGGT